MSILIQGQHQEIEIGLPSVRSEDLVLDVHDAFRIEAEAHFMRYSQSLQRVQSVYSSGRDRISSVP